jgi:peptidoglycan/LPS O-acetylase OafA/YrhL
MKGWTPGSLSPGASAHLDWIRALAALAVMAGHLRALFFIDYQHLRQPGWLLMSIYFLTGFGHQAVMVFFVLSGFLISSSIVRDHLSGKWSWHEYAINRSVRLYIVLIPGLVFGLIWDVAGSAIFASGGVYTHALPSLGPDVVVANLRPEILVCNALFLQTIACHTFGSNGPLWSLANEFWYYVLFPLMFAAGLAWRRNSKRVALSLVVLCLVLGWLLGLKILVGFLIWMSGCVLVLAYSRFRFRRKTTFFAYTLASGFMLLTCLLSARTSASGLLGSDLAVGIAFALLLFPVLQIGAGGNARFYARTAHRLAGFSYSLYVLHFPILLFLRAWAVPQQRWQPDKRHLPLALAIGGIALTYAWLVSLFTEGRTHTARAWVRRLHLVPGYRTSDS